MKKTFLFLSVLLLICSHLFALAAPVNPSPVDNPANKAALDKVLSLSPKQFEKLTGRHLSLKERIAFKLLKWKIKLQGKKNYSGNEGKYEKMATWSMILGIAAFPLAFIPTIGLISIAAAAGAIVLGGISLNKTENKTKSIVGIVLGSVFVLLLILAVVIVAAAFSAL
jgi:hypothetical protein